MLEYGKMAKSCYLYAKDIEKECKDRRTIMHQTPAYARMAHIIALLKSGREASVQAILDSLANLKMDDGTSLACVSKTVIRDIAELKAMGCPLHFNRKLDTYELQDKSWELSSAPLLGGSEMLAVAAGTQFAVSCLPREVGAQVGRVGQAIFEANTDDFDHGADFSAMKILMPPLAPETERVFATVYEGWAQRHLLTIKYTDEKCETTERTIEQQALLFHGMAWYVRAYCYLRGGQRTFLIARIETVKLLDASFLPRPELYSDITFDTFDGREVYKDIAIRLTKAGRQLALAHVLHSKQKFTKDDGDTYTMNTPPTTKHLVVEWILSQRGNAVPLSPAELVEDVRTASQMITEACAGIQEEGK